MNRIHVHARRLAGLLAGLAGTLLALSAGAPAAFALPRPHPGPPRPARGPGSPVPAHAMVRLPGGVLSRLEGPVQFTPQRPHTAVPAHIHAAVTGGMAGWQITLIAIGAALAAATLAVLLHRALTARRRVSATAA
jgi:hypothetical protein